MELTEIISHKWENISKKEQAGLKVLIIFVLGVIIFSLVDFDQFAQIEDF